LVFGKEKVGLAGDTGSIVLDSDGFVIDRRTWADKILVTIERSVVPVGDTPPGRVVPSSGGGKFLSHLK
jgi:hypothetical protein